MHNVIFKGFKKDFQERIKWCEQMFGPTVEVVGPTQASLYRWSYEIIGMGMKQLYFNNDKDFTLYLLKWS